MLSPSQRTQVRANGNLRVSTVNLEESKTVQSDRQRADIRHILAKYEQTGVLVSMAAVDLAYKDVTEFEDFTDVMRQTKQAEAAFMRLPAAVRKIFKNDVSRWLDAAHDPEKLDGLAPQLRELGIIDQVDPDPPPPPPAPPAADPPAAE